METFAETCRQFYRNSGPVCMFPSKENFPSKKFWQKLLNWRLISTTRADELLESFHRMDFNGSIMAHFHCRIFGLNFILLSTTGSFTGTWELLAYLYHGSWLLEPLVTGTWGPGTIWMEVAVLSIAEWPILIKIILGWKKDILQNS